MTYVNSKLFLIIFYFLKFLRKFFCVIHYLLLNLFRYEKRRYDFTAANSQSIHYTFGNISKREKIQITNGTIPQQSLCQLDCKPNPDSSYKDLKLRS